MSKWIQLSKYIPVCGKYIENLISISCQITDIQNNGKLKERIDIPNNILYYINDIKLLLDHKTLCEWETKYLDYYSLLRRKSNIISMDFNKILQVLQDLPIQTAYQNGLVNTMKCSSRLYLVIKNILNKVQRFQINLNKLLTSQTIDIDQLRFIKYKIENEIPRNSPIYKFKFNKALNYFSYMEKFYERKIKTLNFGNLRRDLKMYLNEEFDQHFVNFVSQINKDKGTVTLLDFILVAVIEENHYKHHETDRNTCQDLENDKLNNDHDQWCSCLEFHSKYLKTKTRGFTSKKIRSLLQQVNKFQKWENMVQQCFNTLKDLKERCSSLRQDCSNLENLSFEQKYQRFQSIIEINELQMGLIAEKILQLKKIFDQNSEMFSRSEFFTQYQYLLSESNRVKKLENLFEDDCNPNFNFILQYIDFVLENELCLLPRKSCQITLISKLEKLLNLQTYITNSLKIKQISFQDVIILSQYTNFKSENTSLKICQYSKTFKDFELLLNQLVKKFSENLDLVSKIYLTIQSFEQFSHLHSKALNHSLNLNSILIYLVENQQIFDNPIRGLFNYLSEFNMSDQIFKGRGEVSETVEIKASLENYQKHFIQVICELDFHGDLGISKFRNPENTIRIPQIYEIKLIQRYYAIETLLILTNKEMSHDHFQDLILVIFQNKDFELLLTIWRNLRTLDVVRNTNQSLESMNMDFPQESENLVENDEFYELVMGQLMKSILINFKGFSFGCVDDYLSDLEYIVKYGTIGESETDQLVSEISKIKQFEENILGMIQMMNLNHFQRKKQLILSILDQELHFQSQVSDDLTSTIHLHQPISYDQEMITDQLNLHFPLKRANHFFSKLSIDDLFYDKSISIIESEDPNIRNSLGFQDLSSNTKNSDTRNNSNDLINEYLSILEEERIQILLLLSKSSRYTFNGTKRNETNEFTLKIDHLFRNLIKKGTKITINIDLLNKIVNDWMHFEIAFIINLTKMSQTCLLNDRLFLRQWLNGVYLKYKTPYHLFKSTEIIFDKYYDSVSPLIYKFIRNISLKYLSLLQDWQDKYEGIVENTSRDFYEVLLVYNQSQLIRRMFQGEIDSANNTQRMNDLSNNEIFQIMVKLERIKEEFQKLRDLVGDLMIPFKDYMNKSFNDITTNGLYNMKTCSKFLVYFPSRLIEYLRSKEFDNLDGNHLRIFVEEISLMYFSNELVLLLIKVNMTYKCESYYINPQLLITLSNEIELKSGILIESIFMDSYNYFVKIYRDSLITENYFYLREKDKSKDLVRLVNNKLWDFELNLLNELNGLNDLNFKAFKIFQDESNFKESQTNRFIWITDILSLISNIILYRAFISGLFVVNDQFNKKIHVFKKDNSLLDFDLALKLLVMYSSLKDLVENNSFSGLRSRSKKRDSEYKIFAPIEVFNVKKELSILFDMFSRKEILENTQNRPKIHHYLFEKESMLMEDFRNWEIVSDNYLFKRDNCLNSCSSSEFLLNRILWVPEYENFNTVLDIIELTQFHLSKIKASIMDTRNQVEVCNLMNALETKKKGILDLETNSLKILKEIQQDEKDWSRFETKSESFVLVEKMMTPPKISQKTVYNLISKQLSKLIPNFKLLNQTLNILPFKGFELLTKYFNDSIFLDKNFHSIFSKLCDLETKQNFQGGIVSHNLEYLRKILELRRLMNDSRLSSEMLYKGYLKYFRGIMRYFLIYGSNYRWINISGLSKDQQEEGVGREDKVAKEIFVPILEYSILRKLYQEFLAWYQFDENDDQSKGVFQNCEFIILESLLSCCKYLMEKVSFNSQDLENQYLINHCILRYLYYQKQDEFEQLKLMIGLLDIGEYLVNYLDILDTELIMRQDFSRIEGSEICDDNYQIGSFSVFSRVDNKLLHHFLRKNKIKVSICGLKDPKQGLISNIYYIKENSEKIDFKWSIGRISSSLKPIHGIYFIRSYVKQYIEYIFKAFYNKDDPEYIKKKDHSLYTQAFGKEDELTIGNLFRVLDKYLKDVMDYSLRLILKSFQIKSCDDHNSYSNFSKYPSELEKIKLKWMTFGQKKWISESLLQVKSSIKMSKSLNKKRMRDDNQLEQVLVDKSERSQEFKIVKDSSNGNISENAETVGIIKQEKTELLNENDLVICERLKDHEGVKSDIKFAWLGWLSFGKEEENGFEDITEIGIYQITNQFTKRNDIILRELNKCLDLKYNGIKHSMDMVEKVLGKNSIVVLISSNWSHHLRNCKSKIFGRIFHYNYNSEDYEIFEFEMIDKKMVKEDVRLWLFPCNLTNEDSNRLFFNVNTSRNNSKLPLPISKYYLIGMLVSKSEIAENSIPSSGFEIGNGENGNIKQDEDEETTVLTSLLPNQVQMQKIAEFCHNKCIKSDSKMEFLINNDMFSSAGTLLSSLLSINVSSNETNQRLKRNNKEESNYSSNIYTLRDLANSIKRKISEG